MIGYLEDLVTAMRPAFTRTATWSWFIIAFVGFIMRTDNYGVSSIIRGLCLAPASYPCLLHFFHSTAWNAETFLLCWWHWTKQQRVAYRVEERLVLTGDHTKIVKDARKMPEVETLHQDSETGSKPTYFRGHHWACIGLLINQAKKFWSTPLWIEIHRDSLEEKRSTRIVSQAISMAETMGEKAYLVLDAFFAVGPVFEMALDNQDEIIHIVTRAKKNVIAFLPPKRKKKGQRGRPAKYGEKLTLMNLFDSARFTFQSMETDLYGAQATVRFVVLDLLWKPVKKYVRFILVESPRGRIIIMTTDLTMKPAVAIQLYCKRTSIETLFDSLKILLGGMGYHFWSKYLQPASRKPSKNNGRKQISSKPGKTAQTLQAIEKFVAIQCLILGAIQMLALKFPKEVTQKARCWMRTMPRQFPSEFMTKIAIANIINHNFGSLAKNLIVQIILDKRENNLADDYFEVAA